jgi:hypothetical protein
VPICFSGRLKPLYPEMSNKLVLPLREFFPFFRRSLTCVFGLLAAACLPVAGQTPIFSNLHVEKKNGALTGPALVTVRGKVKRLSKQAAEAWSVTKGQDALLLIAGPPAAGKPTYVLRYYDAETWKRRTLGTVPFSSATLSERDLKDGTPVFVLSGVDGNESVIVVADDLGIRGRLKGTVAPGEEEDTLRYRESKDDEVKSVALTSLLGSDMPGIYEVKAGDASGRYVQFPRDREGLLATAGGQVETGDWGGPMASRCLSLSKTDPIWTGHARRWWRWTAFRRERG